MYFWDSRRLAVDLRNDAVPAATLRNHFIAVLLLGAPSVFYGVGSGTPPDAWDGLRVLGVIGIIIIGIRRAYQANGGDQGTRFVEKSVALLWPLTIQSFVLAVSLTVMSLALDSVMDGRLSADGKALMDDVSMVVLELAVQAWVMWRLVLHIPDTLEPR